MKRLTDWLDEETKTGVSIVHYKMREAMIRLAQYEDTGLTPEEIIDGKLLTGWIPVTERLPELHRDVLVAVCDVNEDDASTFIDCLVDNNDRPTWSTYNGALDRVLAWMPLPDRYRPE